MLDSDKKQIPLVREIAEKTAKLIAIFGKSEHNQTLEDVSRLLDVILVEVQQLQGNASEYEQIQDMLQKQQSINRALIKKELEFREERNSILEELQAQKNKGRNLTEKLNNLSEKYKDKELEILHLHNQLKANKKQISFFDQRKIDKLMEFKFKNTKDIKDPYKSIHKRRQSEDFSSKKRKQSAKKR